MIFSYRRASETPDRPPEDKWLTYFLILIAFIVLAYFIKDFIFGFSLGNEFGWDAKANCAAVTAHVNGLNPYYVKNLVYTKYSYPYLPVTLDVFRPLCAHDFMTRRFRVICLAFTIMASALVSTFSFSGRRMRDGLIKTLFVFGGFSGFVWIFRTGNIQMLSGLLVALTLALLFHGFALQDRGAKKRKAYWTYCLGAAVFGFTLSLKLTFFPVFISLYFLPLERTKKISLLVIALICFITPILVSFLFYHELFLSWMRAITGNIPNQHSPATEGCDMSIRCLGNVLATTLTSKFPKFPAPLGAGVFYAFASALILGSLAYHIIRLVTQEGSKTIKPFLARLDRFLIDNPYFAMRLVTLVIVAIYLCMPRLKDYAFFDYAIYATMIVADLPAGELAVLLAAVIAAPLLAADTQAAWNSQLFPFFNQIFAAIFCYYVLLGDLFPAYRRLKKEAVERRPNEIHSSLRPL